MSPEPFGTEMREVLPTATSLTELRQNLLSSSIQTAVLLQVPSSLFSPIKLNVDRFCYELALGNCVMIVRDVGCDNPDGKNTTTPSTTTGLIRPEQIVM